MIKKKAHEIRTLYGFAPDLVQPRNIEIPFTCPFFLFFLRTSSLLLAPNKALYLLQVSLNPSYTIMPRADPNKSVSCHYSDLQYHHPSDSYHQHSSSSSSSSSSPTPSTTTAATSTPKKKHTCPTCERAFTTSGHLARHSRVHTGERNHKCPFPGCETRCSRQDNLQQQYVLYNCFCVPPH
jgi:uncharacterized Zn-finger protein